MTLTYRRNEREPNEHVWYDGEILALWRGFSAWYYFVTPSTEARTRSKWTRLCPVDFSDGEAIEVYRARKLIDSAIANDAE